jgi:hypothetical protein
VLNARMEEMSFRSGVAVAAGILALPARLGADPASVVSRLVVAGNSVTVPAGQRASRTGMAM